MMVRFPQQRDVRLDLFIPQNPTAKRGIELLAQGHEMDAIYKFAKAVKHDPLCGFSLREPCRAVGLRAHAGIYERAAIGVARRLGLTVRNCLPLRASKERLPTYAEACKQYAPVPAKSR